MKKTRLSILKNSIFSASVWTRQTRLFAGCLLMKWLWFDLMWAFQTSFTPFSTPELYLNTLLAVVTLTVPYACFRHKGLQHLLLWLMDGWLIANLMYSRTYFAAIPLESYGLVGNLADFTASVKDSLRLTDLFFPLSSIFCLWKARGKEAAPRRRDRLGFAAGWLGLVALTCGLNLLKGGFFEAYRSLQSANRHSCGVPMYTLFGHLYYQAGEGKETFTPEMAVEIRQWMEEQPDYRPYKDSLATRTNLVVILCESLESWVLERSVEGKEITPCLNALLRDSSTLYAPHVLTQVAGGRSIDAQLLLNAGMLPIQHGTYSTQYPLNTYYTLTKAMQQTYDAHSYLMTVDKSIVWNQGMVARAFGIDSVIDKPCWVNDEKVGSKKKLGDASFFRQCAQKLQEGKIWPVGTHAYLQCVTYSGHNPFILPDDLKRITLDKDYPQKMKDYLYMANYTDHAIGAFIDYLKSRPDYAETLVVITGDHEGLAADREPLCASKEGKGIVSDKLFTPFIVVNAPVAFRYEPVMGQIDMYPTILNLMRLDDYPWKGIGQSILDPAKPTLAINAQHRIEGDTQTTSPEMIKHLNDAWRVSDLIIRFDQLAENPVERTGN